VNLTIIPNDNYLTKVGAAAGAKSLPDILASDVVYTPNYTKQGLFKDITSDIKALPYFSNIAQSHVTVATYNDKIYAVPHKLDSSVMFYNKDLFKKAGLNPDHPQLSTYADFLAASKKIVGSGAAPSAIAPAPTSEFFQSWFDFYPLYAAESGGKQTVENGKATFNDQAGKDVWSFWAQMYKDGYAPKEAYSGDAFADKKAAMAVVGPWAIAVYKDKVNWGVVPVPTKTGMDASKVSTFTDAKNIGLYSACKNQKTAWDLLKFATSKDQDGKLLEKTGQMPIRTDLPTTYADYFSKNPEYKTFADQASRTVEVPNIPNSVEIWQEIRDSYSKSVIFGKSSVDDGLAAAASKADELAGQS
jgi:multiple sugar transport system substrate-binding protein